jgi:CRP/FNR family cyclic AMP-dependent transcriptional regulator
MKTVTSRNGNDAVVAILEPGDFFDEGCLSGLPRRLLTITAMTDCAVMRLEKSAMTTALNEEPKFSALFIAHLLRRGSRSEQGMADQLINSSEKRVARMLLMLANVDKAGTQPPVTAKISQETLAEMVGTTRSRVSFFMNKFRREGMIDYRGDTQNL